METYFLRTETQEELLQLCVDNGLVYLDEETQEPKILVSSPLHTFDLIGTIYEPTGVIITDPEGDYPEMAPILGYHANLLTDDPKTFSTVQIFVEEPHRVFAGVMYPAPAVAANLKAADNQLTQAQLAVLWGS